MAPWARTLGPTCGRRGKLAVGPAVPAVAVAPAPPPRPGDHARLAVPAVKYRPLQWQPPLQPVPLNPELLVTKAVGALP